MLGFLIILIGFLIFYSPVFASSVLINEFLSNPSSGSDWIELYNPTNSTVDLTNWTLFDSTSNMKALSGSISPTRFITFDVSNRLNNSGDSIYLKDLNGNVQDSFTYSHDPGVDRSIGRQSDGESWKIFTSSSKAITNSSLTEYNTPTPTPNPSPISSTSNNSFTSTSDNFSIGNIPSTINSNQQFNIQISISEKVNSQFFLKAAFKKAGSSNYFGKTLVSGSWVKNSDPFTKQLFITTDGSGNWNGSLTAMVDDVDSGFTGSDNYIFKVAKYTDSGSGPTWSSETTIHITGTATTQSATSSKSTSTKTSPNPTSPSTTVSKSIVKLPTKFSSQSATVAGISEYASPSSTPENSPGVEVQDQKQFNVFPYLGGALIFAGLGSLIYIFLKQRYNSR